jgi:dihydrofolate synthase/folylpolyglutamate synthase
VRIGGSEVVDDDLCRAFARIEAARGGTTLTYFEFGTLAAMLCFTDAGVDVAILEVGLGGRLDAVNIFDADCALVASVDLDHQDYLGDTREAIGFEKAGIFRGARPAICAEADPPASLVAHAREIGADLMVIDRDFGYVAEAQQWRYWGPAGRRHGLPYPALRGAFPIEQCRRVFDRARQPARQPARHGAGSARRLVAGGGGGAVPGAAGPAARHTRRRA